MLPKIVVCCQDPEADDLIVDLVSQSECQKRGDLSFYAYYTLWRNDRMPMYVVSCTSPKALALDYLKKKEVQLKLDLKPRKGRR